MKTLYLLRHAKSKHKFPVSMDDHTRPLNKRGKEDCAHIGRYIQERGNAPQLTLCSDAKRTRQTADLVLSHITPEPTLSHRSKLYLATAGEILKEVATLHQDTPSVMVVAHNPGLQQLCLMLAAHSGAELMNALREGFPTAALACFTIDSDHWQVIDGYNATLTSLVTPALLKNG